LNCKKKIFGALILSCLFTASAQASEQGPEAEKTKALAEKAKKTLEENPNAILLDVRTEAEFQEGHIPGALLLPSDEVKKRAAVVLPNKDVPIFVYCRSGRRSAKAVRELMAMGYTNVHDLGSIGNWPFPTVTRRAAF
jgi:rhodanese-related sulfurtransferase